MVVRSSDLPTSLARVGIDRDLALALQRELQTSGIRILFDSEASATSAVSSIQTSGTRLLFALPRRHTGTHTYRFRLVRGASRSTR